MRKIAHHVHHEEEGILYDSETADVIYCSNGLLCKYTLAVNPDGYCFLTWVSEDYTGRVNKVVPMDRYSAIMWSIKSKAPDDTLERLGVDILRKLESDEPYNLVSSKLMAGKKRFLGYDFLEQNYDGRFFVYQWRKAFGFVNKRVQGINQRNAILWTLQNLRSIESLETFRLMGVREPNQMEHLSCI